jgi:cellobiose phosphorylase
LEIAPVIPLEWAGFRATRRFRSVTYQIEVSRIGEGDEIAIVVDGEPITGTIVPFPQGEKSMVDIEVYLGQGSDR